MKEQVTGVLIKLGDFSSYDLAYYAIFTVQKYYLKVSLTDFVIREIQPEDNPKIAKAIREVLVEFGVPKVGTAYEDISLDRMHETYEKANKTYYVIAHGQSIYGGAGIAPLDNYTGNICELQKMYFLNSVRSKGLGTKMMTKCLDFARQIGFDKCYLETMPYMDDARKLYRKFGFYEIDGPMGDTGHYSCSVWMLKDLKD